MKNSIYTVVALILIGTVISCGGKSEEHLDNAKEHTKAAEKELSEASKDAREESQKKAVEEWGKFQAKSDSTIAKTQQRIDELKVKIEKAISPKGKS